MISIRTPARGATSTPTPEVWAKRFQFAPLREGRQGSPGFFCSALFQFAPLREGRLAVTAIPSALMVFQFAPLREGRLPGGSFQPPGQISIRAPARGATGPMVSVSGIVGFQFAPLREGRPRRTFFLRVRADFNSRPCERGDDEAKRIGLIAQISIHAPARGATSYELPGEELKYFNSRPCERGDLISGQEDRP